MKMSGLCVSNRMLTLLLAMVCLGPLGCSDQGKTAKWSSRDQSIVPTTNQPASLGAVPESGPRLKVQNPNLKFAAIEVLEQGGVSERPLMRANAIEALEPTTEPLRRAVLRGLVDPNEGVRFVAAMSIGRRNLCGVSHLLGPHQRD